MRVCNRDSRAKGPSCHDSNPYSTAAWHASLERETRACSRRLCFVGKSASQAEHEWKLRLRCDLIICFVG
jgi:hypothetical protein